MFWRPPCLLRSVNLQLVSRAARDDDMAIQGVLWRSRGDWLVIRDASVKEGTRPPEKVQGEIVIHRSNVAFIQVLPA
jgi:hypothetical protein